MGFIAQGTGNTNGPNPNRGGGGNRGGNRGGNKGGGGIGPNNPLANPNTTLSGASLIKAAHALANAQTTGPITELHHQVGINNRQGAATQKLTSGYFNQLGTQAQQGTQNEQNIASGLNSTLAGIGSQTQSQLAGIGQNAQQQLQAYTPQGGGGLANAGMQGLTSEIARQQGLAAQDSGAARSFGAQQGANYGSLAASNQGTFGLRGQERLGDIAKATRLASEPLMSKIAALNASKGSLFATSLGKLRQQEITNAFTSKGLNLKGQAIAATLANNAANNATKTSIANANRSAANNRHAHPGSSGSGSGGSGGSGGSIGSGTTFGGGGFGNPNKGNAPALSANAQKAVGYIKGYLSSGQLNQNTINGLGARLGAGNVTAALQSLGINVGANNVITGHLGR